MPPVSPALQSAWDARDWAGVYAFYADRFNLPELDPSVSEWLPLAATLLAMLLCAMLAYRHLRPRHRSIPLALGGIVIDLQPSPTDTMHVAIGGFSGGGKSTAVLPLFDNPDVGILCLALDNSRPIANKFRFEQGRGNEMFCEWSNERGSPGFGVGLDLINGPADVVSEVLVAGWANKSNNDTGKYRRAARIRIWEYFDACEASGEARSFQGIIDALSEKTGQKDEDTACADWGKRLVILQKTLGESLGGDLDLVRAMRQKQKILLRLNRFISPEDAPMLGGMLLIHARMTAQLAGVPFVIIVEEAGQMGDYQQHMAPLAQAGRDRQTPLVIISQNLSKLDDEVVNNVKVWAIGAQENRREVTFAADRLRIDLKAEPNKLYVESFKNMGRGWFYVRAPKIPTQLVRVKQQTFGKPLPSVVYAHDSMPTEIESEYPSQSGHTQIIEHLPTWVADFPALPAPSVGDLEFMSRFEMTPTCWLWGDPETGAGLDPDGYGIVSINGKQQRVHRLMYEWAYGPDTIGFEPSGKPMEIDHLCMTRRCARPEHLEVVTHAENMRRMHARRGHKTKARPAVAAGV